MAVASLSRARDTTRCAPWLASPATGARHARARRPRAHHAQETLCRRHRRRRHGPALSSLPLGSGGATSSPAHGALRGGPRSGEQASAEPKWPESSFAGRRLRRSTEGQHRVLARSADRAQARGRVRRDCRGGDAGEAWRVPVPVVGRAAPALLCHRRPRLSALRRTHAPRRARHRSGVRGPLPPRPRRADRGAVACAGTGASLLEEPCAATRGRRGSGRVAERGRTRGVGAHVRRGVGGARDDGGRAGSGREGWSREEMGA